ncbi:MAG: hypothetical protein WD267_12995 [Balneolales bacterium]
MNIYLDRQYPKNLARALQLLHTISKSDRFTIIYKDKKLVDLDKNNTIVFLFDPAKNGIAPTTIKHYEAGYQVFAFMTRTADKTNLFTLSLQVLSLWKKIIKIIESNRDPFVCTYGYRGMNICQVELKEE